MIIHTVASGDTAYSIAAQYGIDPQLLITNNGIERITTALPVGLNLVVLVPEITHTVGRYDSVRSVAAEYGVSENAIYRNNIILGGHDDITEGQTLVIKYRDEPIYDYDIGGYSYTFIRPDVLDSTLPAMKLLIPFTYGFTSDGEVVELNDERLVARAFHYGIRTAFHLSTLTEGSNFSNVLAHEILANPENWQILADNIIEIMQRKGFTVLDIDFEFLYASEREIYPQFIAFMRNAVSQYGWSLIVALPPKVRSDQEGELYEGIDYRLLGEAADFTLLMTYECVIF